jgi:hypothetical protein
MNSLPEEVFFLIVRKCKIRDIINIKRVCKQYSIDLNNEILERARNNEILEKARGNNKLNYNNLYVRYIPDLFLKMKPNNIPFELSNSEYILYQGFIREWAVYHMRIITINNNKKYVQYIFKLLRDQGNNIYTLSKTIQYNTLNELFIWLHSHNIHAVVCRDILNK